MKVLVALLLEMVNKYRRRKLLSIKYFLQLNVIISKISNIYIKYLLAELKNRLKISIFLWRKKLCISLIFSNFVVSNYKVIYFTLCTTCMQIS